MPSHSEWDLRFAYTGFEIFTLTVGIENVTDEDMPLDWFAIESYDTSFYNGRSCFIYTQFGLRF